MTSRSSRSKLVLDGGKDFFAFWASIVAVTLDFIAGRGKRPRLFYSVVRMSERFDKWINLHGVLAQMDEGETDDGMFGGSTAGEDTLIGQIEQLVRGGDEPKGSVKSKSYSQRPAPSAAFSRGSMTSIQTGIASSSSRVGIS